jgi:TatD DNase family protein
VIDFHAHLDLYPDPLATTRECIERDLFVLSVTTTPSAWSGTAALAEDAPRIRTAIGLHPQIAQERQHELPLFEELLPRTRYVGEVGLDGAPELKSSWGTQQRVFDGILKMCRVAGGRIISIHSRRAATAVLDALSENADAGIPVLHWFSGTQREVKRAIEIGCWFSVGPAMLAGKKGRALAAEIPRDRLLTETDGPFGQVDGRSLLPWECEQAVGALSELWAEPHNHVEAQLHENLRRLVAQGKGDRSSSILNAVEPARPRGKPAV